MEVYFYFSKCGYLLLSAPFVEGSVFSLMCSSGFCKNQVAVSVHIYIPHGLSVQLWCSPLSQQCTGVLVASVLNHPDTVSLFNFVLFDG